MTVPKVTLDLIWPDLPTPASEPGVGAAPGFRPRPTAAEPRADKVHPRRPRGD